MLLQESQSALVVVDVQEKLIAAMPPPVRERVADALDCLLSEGIERAMDRYNRDVGAFN